MTDELIRDWHPLDGRPAPEFIPSRRDGVLVGQRLIEALRVLAPAQERVCAGIRQHLARTTLKIRSAGWHPPRTGLIPECPPLQMMKPRPSWVEIQHMEAGIIWPGRFIKERRTLAAV
jgi:hypothetical protein